MKKQLNRNEIDNKDKWDLTLIYKSDEDFYKDLEIAKKEIKKVDSFKDFLSSSSRLLEYLKYDEKTERLLYKLYYYANLNHDSDTTDTKYQGMLKSVMDVLTKYQELSSFVTPTFMKTDYSVIEKYMEEEKELKDYEFSFKNMYRYQSHTLSESEEKLLSILSDTLSNPSETYEALTDSDMEYGTIIDKDGNGVEMTDSNYHTFISSDDRNERKQAFNMMFDTYGKYKNTITSTYSGDIDTNISTAKLRKFNSARER